jgi:peptidoglycan/LPS O-acetylase OafA/YrhL
VRAAKLWDALRANAYGIFLLHYPAVTWLQYWLLSWQASAIAKAAIVFTAAFAASWAATALLRRIPAVAAVI